MNLIKKFFGQVSEVQQQPVFSANDVIVLPWGLGVRKAWFEEIMGLKIPQTNSDNNHGYLKHGGLYIDSDIARKNRLHHNLMGISVDQVFETGIGLLIKFGNGSRNQIDKLHTRPGVYRVMNSWSVEPHSMTLALHNFPSFGVDWHRFGDDKKEEAFARFTQDDFVYPHFLNVNGDSLIRETKPPHSGSADIFYEDEASNILRTSIFVPSWGVSELDVAEALVRFANYAKSFMALQELKSRPVVSSSGRLLLE